MAEGQSEERCITSKYACRSADLWLRACSIAVPVWKTQSEQQKNNIDHANFMYLFSSSVHAVSQCVFWGLHSLGQSPRRKKLATLPTTDTALFVTVVQKKVSLMVTESSLVCVF